MFWIQIGDVQAETPLFNRDQAPFRSFGYVNIRHGCPTDCLLQPSTGGSLDCRRECQVSGVCAAHFCSCDRQPSHFLVGPPSQHGNFPGLPLMIIRVFEGNPHLPSPVSNLMTWMLGNRATCSSGRMPKSLSSADGDGRLRIVNVERGILFADWK